MVILRAGPLLLALSILCGAGGRAWATTDLWGTRSMGMGGTLRAVPIGESALFLNPAGMSLTQAYVVGALYQYRFSDSGHQVTAAVVDSATKRIAAGLYYSYGNFSPSRTLYNLPNKTTFDLAETIQSHEAGLALSYPLMDVLHLGVTTKYVNVDVEQPEKTPDSLHDGGASTVTLDVGLVLRVLSVISIGAAFVNAIPVDHETFPKQLGMGAAYAMGSRLLVEFDAVLDFDRGDGVKASYHGGAELFLGERFAVRGGAMHDTWREATYATGGLGLVTSKIALDFGLRQMVDGGAETLLAFSARLFVQ